MKKSSLPGAVSARPGPCEDREFELMEYVDGAAPTTAGLERHLEACGPCRAFVAELTALTGSLRQTLPPPALAADFDAKLRERIGRLTRSSARLEALAAEERAFAEL
ncbi:MAG: anti-sigma factor family protein, partial [Steroidobacteraceae bacterium]